MFNNLRECAGGAGIFGRNEQEQRTGCSSFPIPFQPRHMDNCENHHSIDIGYLTACLISAFSCGYTPSSHSSASGIFPQQTHANFFPTWPARISETALSHMDQHKSCWHYVHVPCILLWTSPIQTPLTRDYAKWCHKPVSVQAILTEAKPLKSDSCPEEKGR